jgi:hypothetical protein
MKAKRSDNERGEIWACYYFYREYMVFRSSHQFFCAACELLTEEYIRPKTTSFGIDGIKRGKRSSILL